MISYNFIQKILIGCLSKPGLYDVENYTSMIEERNDLSHHIEYLLLDSLKFNRENYEELDKSKREFRDVSDKIKSIKDALNFKIRVSNMITNINSLLPPSSKKVDEIIKSFSFCKVHKFSDDDRINYRINDFIVNKNNGTITIKKNGNHILKDLNLIGCLITIKSGSPILVFDKDYVYKVNCSFNDIYIEKCQPLIDCSGILNNYLKKYLIGQKYLAVTNEEYINILRVNSKIETSLLFKNNMNKDLYIICRSPDNKQHSHKFKLNFPKEVLPYIDLSGFTVYRRNFYKIYLIKSNLFTSINYIDIDCTSNTIKVVNGESFKGDIISDSIQLDIKHNLKILTQNIDQVEDILKQNIQKDEVDIILLFLNEMRKELMNE